MSEEQRWVQAGVEATDSSVHVVFGQHHYVPGVVTAVCADPEAADRIAADLVNAIRADADLPPAEGDWRTALQEARAAIGDISADLPDVWIIEEALYRAGVRR